MTVSKKICEHACTDSYRRLLDLSLVYDKFLQATPSDANYTATLSIATKLIILEMRKIARKLKGLNFNKTLGIGFTRQKAIYCFFYHRKKVIFMIFFFWVSLLATGWRIVLISFESSIASIERICWQKTKLFTKSKSKKIFYVKNSIFSVSIHLFVEIRSSSDELQFRPDLLRAVKNFLFYLNSDISSSRSSAIFFSQ